MGNGKFAGRHERIIAHNGWRINIIYTSHLIKLKFPIDEGERVAREWGIIYGREQIGKKSLLMEPVEFFRIISEIKRRKKVFQRRG